MIKKICIEQFTVLLFLLSVEIVNGQSGLEYQGKYFNCDDDSVAPILTVVSRDNESIELQKYHTYTATEFYKSFKNYPKVYINNKNAPYYYTYSLEYGKNNRDFRYLVVNVPAYSALKNKKPNVKVPSVRLLQGWNPRYPSVGERYHYELKVIKQKREALLPNNGKVDVPWEWHNNLYPFLCVEVVSIVPFYIEGDAQFDTDPQKESLRHLYKV